MKAVNVLRILIFVVGTLCVIELNVGLIVFTTLSRGEVMTVGSIGTLLYLILASSLTAGVRDN